MPPTPPTTTRAPGRQRRIRTERTGHLRPTRARYGASIRAISSAPQTFAQGYTTGGRRAETLSGTPHTPGRTPPTSRIGGPQYQRQGSPRVRTPPRPPRCPRRSFTATGHRAGSSYIGRSLKRRAIILKRPDKAEGATSAITARFGREMAGDSQTRTSNRCMYPSALSPRRTNRPSPQTARANGTPLRPGGPARTSSKTPSTPTAPDRKRTSGSPQHTVTHAGDGGRHGATAGQTVLQCIRFRVPRRTLDQTVEGDRVSRNTNRTATRTSRAAPQ